MDINTASPALLEQVSGLNRTLADNIVRFRDEKGAFRNRRQLMEVPRLGEKTFEQAAGFLKIHNGENPLDASSVHPEAYPVVERILGKSNRVINQVIGDVSFLRALKPVEFTDDVFGAPTVIDIIAELEKPGRDPRGEFKTATFQDGVEAISDLEQGMILEGVVTNVTNFGAFIDIGVHQDGLVHISAMSEKFIKDPREVVKAGDLVKVKVMDVDQQRRRISLSMRLGDQLERKDAADKSPEMRSNKKPAGSQKRREKQQSSQPQGAMAAALASALTSKR